MNTRFKILMVVGIALILPAVAFADVAISGTISVHGSQQGPTWYITDGPNAPEAAGFASISPHSGTQGDMDLENAYNMSVFTINVFQINFNTTGTFYLNVTQSHAFPNQARLYFSTSLMNFNDFSSEAATSINNSAPIPTTGSGIFSLNLSDKTFTTASGSSLNTAVFHIDSTSVVIYIGFYLTPGDVSGAEITLSGNFVLS
jgi:hypothetical protein